LNVAVALAYFASAKLGLALAFSTESVTAVWPPTGIALAALVLGGRRLWPGVALGAFVANVTTDVPVYTAVGITAGNTLEALVGASLLMWVGFRPTLRRLQDILALVVLAGLVSTTISATIGVASVSLGDSLSGDAWSAWRLWWLGDMSGDLLVASFLFVAVTHWPYREVPGHPLEALLLVAGLIAVGLVAFSQSVATAYLIFPFLIWATLRFLQPGATTAAIIAATIAVAFTANGSGQFVVASEDDSLLLAQTFCAVVGISVLILASATSQRRDAERTARGIAHTFQTELLPPALPEIPHMEAAAWYRAGAPEQEVGGDFYDVFEASPGRWVAVIGDVCGKGPEAASLTALARYTLRAVGRQPIEPSEALRTLNDAILEQRSDQRFMTVVLAQVIADDDAHVVTVSNGGHPLPLLLRANGELREVGRAGTLLGIYGDPRLANHRVEMEPGDALILLTDGLNERRDPSDEPTRRIWEALGASAGASAGEIVARMQVLAPADDHEASDDVAVLVLRRSGVPSPRAKPPPRELARSGGWIAVDLKPTPESAPLARAAISGLGDELEPGAYADLRLLVTELVTNSVRHAGLSPDDAIHLRVTWTASVLRVEVTDRGIGFEPGTPPPARGGSGGWGLLIAERLADRWGVEREGRRTKVWLEKDLHPNRGTVDRAALRSRLGAAPRRGAHRRAQGDR
jgi:integral membrane sensor domain MASE1/anti-sigma regulatory factor (Ser/Thr protein kinase)